MCHTHTQTHTHTSQLHLHKEEMWDREKDGGSKGEREEGEEARKEAGGWRTLAQHTNVFIFSDEWVHFKYLEQKRHTDAHIFPD